MCSLRQHEALAAIAAGQVAPVYLLYGGQPLLEQELLAALREQLVPPGTEAFNYHVVEAGPDQVGQVLSLVQTLPFMAARRLVVMRKSVLFSSRRGGRSGEEGAEGEPVPPAGEEEKQLLAYLRQPAPFACLVITVDGEPDRRRQLYRAVEAAGVVVDCSQPGEEDAAQWCQVRAQRLGKRLDPEAARILVEKVGTDLTLLGMELEKLVLYTDGEEIGPDPVLKLVSGATQVQVFDLIDAVAEGQVGRAVHCLAQMLQQGEPPLRLLALIAGHFRRLLEARALADQGVTPARAAQERRQRPYYWEKLMRQARRFSREDLVRALERILEVDVALKTRGGDEQLVLEMLLMDLAALRTGAGPAW
ncbi:MAG: DNA polymerase III subunit delta [Firmicutes bacterium]|nr:DNA polymerase III subunit delta [Bacillota bacterium]